MRHTLVLVLGLVLLTNGQENDTALEELDPNQEYCLRFTWLGPEFDANSNYNTTCSEILDEKRSVNTPCRQPLVVTYDGTEPNLQYIWEYHKNRVACRRAKGQVCAKFSYIYNNEVMNVTYMCTRVSAKDEGVITSGCYSQTNSGYETEVCVCEPRAGVYLPCNSSTALKTSTLTAIFCVFLSLFTRKILL